MSQQQQPKLTVFLDIVSPFAYMAFYVTQRSPVFKKCEVQYIPIFLGGVMKACDNRPPLRIKNKDVYIDLERRRYSKQYNIPMSEEMPKGFPPMTLQVMRTLAAIEQYHPAKLVESFSALYEGMWVDQKPVHEPEVFGEILGKVLGEEVAKSVVEMGTQAEAKQKLQQNTELALEEKAFGLPWFVATNTQGQTERYWGFDHLGQVIMHLGLDGNEARGLTAML